jgi:DNA modification methylase
MFKGMFNKVVNQLQLYNGERMKYLKQYDIKCGDALEQLRMLNDESIDMVITSPPYFRMRDYKESRQIGMEDLPEQFIIRLCDIFLEVKRVLKPTGTLWVNIADTYGQNWRWGGKDTATELQKGNAGTMDFMGKKGKDVDVPKKSLCCIPARFQIEMVRCGWALRNTIIWHKPNCMPSSVKDRFTVDYEYLFFFSKSEKYYFNQQKEAQGRNKRCVWTIPTQANTIKHYAMFPEKLVETPILAGCPPGGIVLDPFCGTATTGVVAMKMGKSFLGIDIKQEYCEIARERLEWAKPKSEWKKSDI